MVNKYPFVRQEKESWSLPACIHSIIMLRRPFELEPLQEEIAMALEDAIHSDLSLDNRLRVFLEEYNLGLRYEHPFTNVRGDSILLEGELNDRTDVIAAYDWNRIHNRQGKSKKQFSIVLCYDCNGKNMVVRDSLGLEDMRIDAINLKKFRSAVNPVEDRDYGFYMIDD